MSCAICGKPTLIGARLCSPCRAALKRAKDDTVFELPPGRSAAVRRRQAVALADPAPEAVVTAVVVPAPRARRLRAAGLGLLCAAAFGATGLHLAAQGGAQEVAVATAAEPARVAATETPAGRRSASQPQGDDASSAGTPPTAGTPLAPGTPTPSPGPSSSGERPLVHRVYDTLVRPPRESAHAAVKAAPAPPEPPPVVAPAPVTAPAPVKVAVAAPVAPVRVDPWQALDAALAQCAADSLFARLACEHRARARYCEGRWGDPTHCPSAVNVDHGQ